MEIIKDSTQEAWKAMLKSIMADGTLITDKDKRVSWEVLNAIITIKNPSQDITKPIESMRELKKWVYPELDELEDVFFTKEASFVYYYTYGVRIFNYSNAKNQVDDFIIPLLQKDPTTRRAVIVLYYPVIDSNINIKETPSLLSLFFKIVGEKLTVTSVIRSNDMFIGWPANIYQIYLLQKHVAEKIGVEPGSITTISHSAHLFQEYKEEIDSILRKD